MPDATFCPLLFIPDIAHKPEEIEKQQIQFLNNHIMLCEKFKIQIYFSSQLFDYICNSFPWNLKNDPKWKMYILLWESVVFGPIQKKAKFINVSNNDLARSSDSYKCKINSFSELMMLLIDWSNNWKDGPVVKDKCLKAVISEQKQCLDSSEITQSCESFVNIKCCEDYDILLHPWKLIYPILLPHCGEFYFIPPENWMNNEEVLRGDNYGYVDVNGNEWVWDKLHKDHWDVQLPKGGYKRITSDGRDIT